MRVRTRSTKSAIRIFIVDDSADFRGVVSRFLSLQPRYKVVGSSPSNDLAIDQIRDLKPDLIIIDFVLPWMSGMEAARLVKKQPVSPRVIIMSFQEMFAER